MTESIKKDLPFDLIRAFTRAMIGRCDPLLSLAPSDVPGRCARIKSKNKDEGVRTDRFTRRKRKSIELTYTVA